MGKTDNAAATAFMSGRAFSRSNTTVIIEGNDTSSSHVYLSLYGHIIAERCGTDIRVTTAGHPSMTTKARLNAIPGVQVNTKRGRLYLNGAPWDGSWHAVGGAA